MAMVYLDTNVFIRGYEAGEADSRSVRRLLLALRAKRGVAVTSELTVAEVLAPVRRPSGPTLRDKEQLYATALLWSDFIDLIPASRELLVKTAALRRQIPFKLADAIHVVTALHTGCSFFVSDDNDARVLPAGLRRLTADEAGVDQVVAALDALDTEPK